MTLIKIIAAFLVAIGILVAVHEFGHYWVAKRLGFKVLRFSIGFGKPLFMRIGKDPDRTEYCIAAIPLGGYVKLLDEREGDVPAAELHRSFTRRPVAHRIAVLLAGPAMNLLFASLLYAVLAMVGTEVITPVVSQVRLDSPASQAGMMRGDTITRVGSRTVDDLESLQIDLMREISQDSVIPIEVRRADGVHPLTLRVTEDRRAMTEPGKLLPGLGFDLGLWTAVPMIKEVPSDSAGARAGLRVGDTVLKIDGRAVSNRADFIASIYGAPGQQLSIEVGRAGQHVVLAVDVPRVVEQGKTIGRLGIAVDEGTPSYPPGLTHIKRLGPVDALVAGVARTWDTSSITVQMLWRIVTGEVSAKNINGPISIAEIAGASASMGLGAFASFLVLVSVSLGVLNLMPVPLLDGGQVVYQLVEAVKGSPLSERAQIFGQQVGIALLVVLMSFAFYNDISRHFN